ncbi:lim and transglutaminase domain protein ltd-1-like [Mya arenaria]|uniref:lim and transglutaminase domain protein ltd-1-like n=1 Tax=Mya arenaria TaxID=6604 RepID=UPI0022E780BB|nr:lim and transglutaminase domain protein ltd-1-like [Mya arenaria]
MAKLYTYDERVISFYNMDEHMKKITSHNMSSVASLLDYIEEVIPKNDENKEIYIARGIIVWIANVDEVDLRVNSDLQNLLDKSRVLIFHELCRKAGIECEIIKGAAKAAQYIPGVSTMDTLPHMSWATFRCNNMYHLVNPQWATSSLVGFEREGETVLENDGQLVQEFEESAGCTGVNITLFDEFWFCTHPRIYVLHAFPDNSKWQLLPADKILSPKDFELALTPDPQLFILGLEVVSGKKCIYESTNGRCWIDIMGDPSTLKEVNFKHQLSFVSGTGDLTGVNPADLPQLVMKTQTPDTVSLEVRLPVTGEYMLKIFARLINDAELKNCFEIRIRCNEADPACRKLPIDAGDMGFGFSTTASECGLSHPSQNYATLKCEYSDSLEKKETLKFKVDPDRIDEVEFSSEIVGSDEVDVGVTTTHVDQKGNLEIVTALKKEGEFALVVKAREANTPFKPIMNYLVSTFENDEETHGLMVAGRKRELATEKKTEEKHTLVNQIKANLNNIQKEIEQLLAQAEQMS